MRDYKNVHNYIIYYNNTLSPHFKILSKMIQYFAVKISYQTLSDFLLHVNLGHLNTRTHTHKHTDRVTHVDR